MENTKKESNFISAVLYVHNNEQQLEKLLPVLDQTLSENFKSYEIICVNDATHDKSVEYIRQYVAQSKKTIISIVNMSLYQGIELSMNAGVDLAIGDFIYEFDDLTVEYPINLILDVYHKSLEGFDIVSASPDKITKLTSRVFYNLFNRFSQSLHPIHTDIFRIISRRAVNRIHALTNTIPYRKAIYVNCGLKTTSLKFKSSNYSYSNMLGKTRSDIAFDSLIIFTNLAYKVAFYLCLILLIGTVLVGIYTFVIYLGPWNKPISGWTTTMLVLSGSFSGVFLLFAIIIKYLNVIVDLLFKKQRYLIESIEKIAK